MADRRVVMGQDGSRKQADDGGTMSDHQGHPRSGGDAGTPGDLAADVDALRVDVAALVGRFDSLSRELAGLRSRLGDGSGTVVEELQDNLADVASGEVVGALWDEVRQLRSDTDELATLRSQLPTGTTDGVDAVADQVAALRDFVASELDTVRQTVAARIDAAAEATAATVAAASPPEPAPSSGAEVQATTDPETVEMLRDEIRAAGAISDQVVDALSDELKALRRRIAVKASERVLDDQQLAQIADAVVERLARDRAEG
jgi:archaellum component FlaC